MWTNCTMVEKHVVNALNIRFYGPVHMNPTPKPLNIHVNT